MPNMKADGVFYLNKVRDAFVYIYLMQYYNMQYALWCGFSSFVKFKKKDSCQT
jgi:hypothetical protein